MMMNGWYINDDEFVHEVENSDFIIYGKNNKINIYANNNFKEKLKEKNEISLVKCISELCFYIWTTGNKTFDEFVKLDIVNYINKLKNKYKTRNRK